MTRMAVRSLLTKSQYLFVRKAGKMIVRDNLVGSDSDSTQSEVDPRMLEEADRE